MLSNTSPKIKKINFAIYFLIKIIENYEIECYNIYVTGLP